MEDPRTLWLTVTNCALGALVLAAFVMVLAGTLYEMATTRRACPAVRREKVRK